MERLGGGLADFCRSPQYYKIVSPISAAFGDSGPESIANQRKNAFDDPIVSVGIDCGTDDDDSSIDTGVRATISDEFIAIVDKQGRTLRSFPNGTRNCYALKPPNSKINQKYIVKAGFVYGNYDKLNIIPRFDLHIGVNKWKSVSFENSSTYSYYEIIYASSTDHVDVCLVNTGSGEPFITVLELRVLDDSMYTVEPGFSLLSAGRYDAGAPSSADPINDEYGRDWDLLPEPYYTAWISGNTDLSIQTQSDGNPNDVPDTVLTTVGYSNNVSIPLSFRWKSVDGSTNSYHLYFYFAEIFKGSDPSPRTMAISLNSNPPTDTITLTDFLTPKTIGPLKANLTAAINFSIDSVGMVHGAIVNAFEIFVLNELPNRPTDTEDVIAMMDIKKVFNVRRNWQGDPCVPNDLSWEGVGCRYDDPPRIVSLNLSSSNLTGDLPDSLSKLSALQSLDLSNNKLTGSVPSDLKKIFKDTPEQLRLDGNQLCMSEACNQNKSHSVLILVIVIVTLLAIAIIFILALFLRSKRQKQGSLKSKDRQFAYSEIVAITSNFKSVIGEGGFGKVYHGVLTDQTPVAVKMLSKSSNQGSKEFRAEAQLLTIVHHRNLVSLVGYCDENEHMGLLYEYMANGNLQQHLSETNDNALNWRERLQVAVSSAQGLEYLHNGCKPPFIHRDLKPSNILLDDKMQAKIADFGLSRAFLSDTRSFMETIPAGTLGYLDPEYQASGNLNKKSDVYSFGIILLELITGQRAITRGSENSNHIVNRVLPIIHKGDIRAIVDPRLHGEFKGSAAWKIVEVAMSCVEPTAIQRPDMNHVLVELKEALELEMRVGRDLSVEGKEMRSTDYSMLEFSEDMTPQAR